MKPNKKCKHCKQPMSMVYNSLQKYCVDKPECVEVWVSVEKEKQWKKRKAKLKQDAMTLSDYMKLAQQVFNKWVRQRDEGQPCISCGKKINGVTHASHYKSQGGHSNVRFHELNVWSSCYRCNVELSGNLLRYRERLIEKIGLEKVTEIEKLSMIERKWSIEEVKEIIKKYKSKLK